jgi:hypothetical protein
MTGSRDGWFPAPSKRHAYCGPGRTLATALLLACHGETVDEITETTLLPDPDVIIVVDASGFPWPGPGFRDDFRNDP